MEKKTKDFEKEMNRLQELVAEKAEKESQSKSKESEKEVKRLQSLIAELVEEEEVI